jgi:hypothetical protein
VRVLKGLLFVILSASCLGAILAHKSRLESAEFEAGLENERESTFRWFGTLDYPDVTHAPFVDVATGEITCLGDDRLKLHDFGFLLKGGESFTILTLALEVKTFKRGLAHRRVDSRVDYQELDLPNLAEEYLKKWPDLASKPGYFQDQLWHIQTGGSNDKSEPDVKDPGHFFGELGIRKPAQIFVAAWACRRKGFTELANRLYDRAQSLWRDNRTDAPIPLREFVEENLSWAEIVRITYACDRVDLTRTQLREDWRRLVKNFPQNECVPDLREGVEILDRMIREDEARARQTVPAFEMLTKAQQVAELIYQLRDQGGYRVFEPHPGEDLRDSPGERLARMGYDVVPALLDVLDDQRITRSIDFQTIPSLGPPNWRYLVRHRVLSVGECAKYVIEKIAARSFPERQTADLKRAIRAWYADLQRRGEKRMLAEGVEAGDSDSPPQAARLVERYPRDAFAPLVKGAEMARADPERRAALVKILGKLDGEQPTSFLLRELKTGPFASTRIAAAEALRLRNRHEGIDAIVVEWNSCPKPVDSETGWANGGIWALEQIADFLAHCGSSRAAEALESRLRERPVRLRTFVIYALAARQDGPQRPPQTRAAIERLLISELDDEEPNGETGWWWGKISSSPRICDYAGQALNATNPAKFAFDIEAPLPERNRMRDVLKKASRN